MFAVEVAGNRSGRSFIATGTTDRSDGKLNPDDAVKFEVIYDR